MLPELPCTHTKILIFRGTLYTDKNHALVECALAGMGNQLSVSNYELELPTKAAIQRFIEEQISGTSEPFND